MNPTLKLKQLLHLTPKKILCPEQLQKMKARLDKDNLPHFTLNLAFNRINDFRSKTMRAFVTRNGVVFFYNLDKATKRIREEFYKTVAVAKAHGIQFYEIPLVKPEE